MKESIDMRTHRAARASWVIAGAAVILMIGCETPPIEDSDERAVAIESAAQPSGQAGVPSMGRSTPVRAGGNASTTSAAHTPSERTSAGQALSVPANRAPTASVASPPGGTHPSSSALVQPRKQETKQEPPISVGDPGTFVRAKEEPPKLIAELSPAPEYPLHARQKRLEGAVLLRITVSDQGAVSDVEVAASSGFASLDEAALEGVKGWHFEPAKRGLVAIEKTIEHSVRFKLSD